MKVRVFVGAPVEDMTKRLKPVSICPKHQSSSAGNLQTRVFWMGSRTHPRVAVAGGSGPGEEVGCSTRRRLEVEVQPILKVQRDSVSSFDVFDIVEGP